jgi:diguanylate cyclase (GGDEF)-like protein/PAS domain S-box-containing protein
MTTAVAREIAPDLAEEYEALIQFLYVAPVGLIQTGLDGSIVMINPLSAQLLMPLSRDGGLSNLFGALEGVAPDLRHQAREFKEAYGMICEGLRIQVSAGVRGQSDPQILSLSLLKLDDTRLMAVINDISLQVKRERLLRQNEAWLNAILTGITDYAVVSLDREGRIGDWNPSIGRLTGFDSPSVIGKPYSILSPEDASTADRVRDRLFEAEANGWSLDEGWQLKADGSRFWGSALIAPLHDRPQRDGQPPLDELADRTDPAYCLVIRDITDKREENERNRKAHSCDHLTGIANRRTFFEATERELARRRRSPRELSLILFDADHFKQVNDTHGHPAGDAVLKHFASVLSQTFRQVDVVARIGGEEFAALLPSTGQPGALVVAERLRAAIESASVIFDGACIRYTVSAGIAVMDDSLGGLDELLKRADHALYAAKAGGRNRISCWTPV